MQYSSISRLVIVPVMISIAILVALNTASISKTFSVLSEFEHIDQTWLKAERDISSVSDSFKTQVQEWKNVLLRGKKDSDRNKYWERFQAREAEIQQALNTLRDLPSMSDENRALIAEFLRAHDVMATQYRAGYQAFVAANYDPSVGDSFVRGIDREPAKLLLTLANNIADDAYQAMSSTTTATRQTMWGILFGSILLSALSIWFVIARLNKEVLRPTKRIAKCLVSLQKNDYSFDLAYTSSHELGHVAEAVRQLQAKLHASVQTLQASNQEVQSSSKMLDQTTAKISHGAHTQTQVSSTLQSRTEQMRDISRSLAAIAQQVGAATTNSDETVSTCHTIFSKANEGFAQLADKVTESASIVHELQARSTTILNVVNVINEIADQTNLLALNAAIEAARAGDHGRGFAVVADEVRALAAKTQQSTREINEILSAFEKDATNAVTTMDSGKLLSEENAQQAASALEQLDDLVKDVKETASVVVTLQNATEEQNTILSDVEGASSQVVSLAAEYRAMAEDKQISETMQTAAQKVSKVMTSLSA